MLTKNIRIGEEYAYTPRYWGHASLPVMDEFRVLVIDKDIPGFRDQGGMCRHLVLHMDDNTGKPLHRLDGSLRFYYATSAELGRTWHDQRAEFDLEHGHWETYKGNMERQAVKSHYLTDILIEGA